MRINPEETIFIAVDYQERLMPAIHNNEKILKKTEFLLQGLKELEIPMIMTTQYQKGLGPNAPAVRELIGDDNCFDKTTFSLYQDNAIRDYLDKSGKRFVILAGTETHICILQSLVDLADAGFIPVLVEDCSGSRFPEDEALGLKRIEQEGILTAGAESLLYELMVSAKHPHFKAISNLVKAQG